LTNSQKAKIIVTREREMMDEKEEKGDKQRCGGMNDKQE